MKRILPIYLFAGLILFSCADDSLSPIITFDKAGKGAYVRLLQETARDLNLFDLAGSNYNYSVEFVDLEQGNLVSEYKLDLIFQDNNPDNGDNSSGPSTFRSWSASEFGTTERGFKGVDNITITANDLLSAVGISADALQAGDQFIVKGFLILSDGSVFGKDNSSAAVNGSAFQGHFDFTLNATCPTNLAGTYDYTVLESWCGGLDCPTGQVTLTLTTSGYDIDDFSLGAYNQCYSPCTGGAALPLGNLRLVDVCNKISVTGASQWGEIYTYHSLTVDGNDLIIEWTNDYGEGGTTAIHNPSGWPPLELK
jgi:hypothetical protein